MERTKKYLSQARYIMNRIKSLELQLEYLNNKALGPSGPIYDKDTFTLPRSLEAPFVKYLDPIDDVRKKINEGIEKLLKLQAKIKAVISLIDDPVVEIILIERYVNCLTFETIAENLHFSQSYVYKLHRTGLKLVKIPKEDSKVE